MTSMCQSCGMPLKKDPNGGGTNADGGPSLSYCSFCYQGGAFTQIDITAQEMQNFCQGKLREVGHGRITAWLFTRGIPRLGRWR